MSNINLVFPLVYFVVYKNKKKIMYAMYAMDVGKVVYDGDSVVECAWTTTACICDVRFREHTGQG